MNNRREQMVITDFVCIASTTLGMGP